MGYPASALYMPGVQSSHAVAAILAANLPGPHSRHSPVAADLYLLSEQAVQFPPGGPSYPALQMQSVSIELPFSENDSAGHAVQLKASVEALRPEYFPPTQLVHTVTPVASA